MAAIFKETPCEWEADPKGIETTLYQKATGLQSTAEGYLALASNMSQVVPYELPQIVAQIPSPPMDAPMPIRKALLIDGESKAVSHLIHGEYELTNTSWSKLQKKLPCQPRQSLHCHKGKKKTWRFPILTKEENKEIYQTQSYNINLPIQNLLNK